RKAYITVATVVFAFIMTGLLILIVYLVVRRLLLLRKDPIDNMKVAVAQSQVLKVVEEHNDRVLSALAKTPANDEPNKAATAAADEKDSEKSTDAKEKSKS
ncbi:hypothetical protein PFISCL1PPCAC_5013, partial [Pristionchus fissidentatus]